MHDDSLKKYSPLLVLAKKVALYIALPMGTVIAVLYIIGSYESPTQREANQSARKMERKIEQALEPSRRAAEDVNRRAADHPNAARLEAELSKLSPADRQKRVNDLMDELARKEQTKHQKP